MTMVVMVNLAVMFIMNGVLVVWRRSRFAFQLYQVVTLKQDDCKQGLRSQSIE